MKKLPESEQALKELFDCVYQWGRVGVKADYTNKVYREKITKVIDIFYEGVK